MAERCAQESTREAGACGSSSGAGSGSGCGCGCGFGSAAVPQFNGYEWPWLCSFDWEIDRTQSVASPLDTALGPAAPA
eukprot:COSAG06_NODE_34830_length_468_cov_2.525745_1_plen_77_part_01